MALVLKNRVKVTSTTTGTGTFTLGSAVAGYQDFSEISPASAAWDISKSVQNNQSYRTSSQTTLEDVFFKPDGTKMYVVGFTIPASVHEYSLSVAWDVSTASVSSSFAVNGQDTAPTGVFFKPDGTKMYVVGLANDNVYEYDLSTAWDVTSASYLRLFSVSAQESQPQAVFFKPDGTKMYICGTSGDDVNEYSLGTPWDVSTASYVQNFSVSANANDPEGLFFKSDGTSMYIVGHTYDTLVQYDLSSAWDISTASYVQSVLVGNYTGPSSASPDPSGIFFKSDGSAFWIAVQGNGGATSTVQGYYVGATDTYYIITDGTDYEAGKGICLPDSTLIRNQVFASSNSNALVNWGAGDKDVLCGYPAEGTPGGVPFCDDSEIGTDLSGWQAFRTALEAGITGGQTYNNNGVNGVVSTYSLVYTVSEAYTGGVLAPNGDIHFIPWRASVGQKISPSGVVSTYSLVYTGAATTDKYVGGVLAPNGDIHFSPATAAVGQKISASGVVSTYSLVYTTTLAYAGGVLAPNGDIHFIPRRAAVGQKVSAAGVVSTYSLVYTAGEYFGGVLASNGDIHFVPFSVNRGQKISAAGVVSTYSLVYSAGQYRGGVISPNGDIHFIPLSANRGQKISAAGVVSTYSLVYTTTNAYLGGVLAPNGEIHFIPWSANRGQKISVTGTVSTYSLAFTTSLAYQGGVLSPNGDIHFIPFESVRGQKISTNPGQALGPGICLSSFLNKF